MIECVPTASAAVVQVAILALPAPASATAPQPPMAVAPSANWTLPDGAEPVTVAVNVTLAPTVAGLDELANAVVVDGTVPEPSNRTSSTNAV